MLTLIENGHVYTPDPRGKTSVLLANEKIEKIGKVSRRSLDELGCEYEVIDATDCVISCDNCASPRSMIARISEHRAQVRECSAASGSSSSGQLRVISS